MRRNIKTIFITVLSFLCLVCFMVGCSKSSKSSSTLLENFNDEEITVQLGENYRLELAPLTEENAYYEITASVVDSQGNKVKVLSGYFTITDVHGYVITYTATGSGEEKQRKVRLTVENDREPNVFLGDCDTTYEIGETFTFPTITVYDLAGEELTPTAMVYKLEGEDKIEQALATETTFLCENEGTYLFEATATNSFGITGVKQITFYVNALQVGEVEAFDNAGSKNDVQVYSKYTEGCTWIDKTDASMGERQGVLKVNVKKTNQQRSLFTVYPKQAYANYMEMDGEEYKNKKFVVSMYVEAPVGSIPEMYAHFTSYRIKDVKYNMWYDYTFDAKIMLDAYAEIVAAEQKVAEATDAQALATAQKELESLQNNALSIWGTFTTKAVIYIDRIAFVESEATTSVPEGKSYTLGDTVSLATEMPVEGYDNVEYTVLLEGKPVAITNDAFTPEYVSDGYTVVASVRGVVNELNDNAEFAFEVVSSNDHTARLNSYTATVSAGEEAIEPTLEIYDGANNEVEGYTITRYREFVSNAGVRTADAEFTLAKSGTFEYTLTAEKDGVKFFKTATLRVGPFGEYEVISLARQDVLELFGTTKGALLTQDDLNGLKTSFAGVNETPLEQVLRFSKNNSDKSFELNFKPVHTVEYYKEIASVKPTISVSVYLASANTNITEFSVEMFQDAECTYTVQANTWTTIEIPIDAMIAAMEDNRLYPANTWTHCAMKIKPTKNEAEYSIADTEFNLFLGDMTLIGDEHGDNYVQDW